MILILWPTCQLSPPDLHEHKADFDSVTAQSGVKSKIKPPAPSAAVEVTASNFDEVVLNDDKDVLVAFTAPWVWRITMKRTSS